MMLHRTDALDVQDKDSNFVIFSDCYPNNRVIMLQGYKKLPRAVNDGVATDRYRLLVSDGQKFSYTMLATQLNNLITDEILTDNAICRILNYQLRLMNYNGKERPVMVIKGIEVLVSGSEVGHKIGNPTNIDIKSDAEVTSTSTSPFPTNGAAKRDSSNHHASSDISTTPIAALSPDQNRWVIKVRVTKKSPIKPWSNSRGEGKLFSMDLVDKSGEIRCAAFDDECDKFYDMIEPGNVYYISRCTLKAAKKQFNKLKHDYEMTMTGDTRIVPCHENSDDIPTLQFNFCPISQVENKEEGALIDVLGVVTTVNDVQHTVQRNTGRKLMIRDVDIVDDSGTMVRVTLWRKQAKDFDGSNNPILAIKGACVKEFNGGKHLSLIMSSVLKKDPDLPEAHRLRGWYTSVGHSQNAKSLSRAGGSGDFNAPLYTFQKRPKLDRPSRNAVFKRRLNIL